MAVRQRLVILSSGPQLGQVGSSPQEGEAP